MVGHGGSSAGSYLADPTYPIPSHCASIVVTSTIRVNVLSACIIGVRIHVAVSEGCRFLTVTCKSLSFFKVLFLGILGVIK